MDLMLSGDEVLIGLFLLSCTLLVAIVLCRHFINRKNLKSAHESYYRKKYESVDILRHTARNWFIGLGSSLSAVLLLMSWTTYEKEYEIIVCNMGYEEEIEVIPRTSTPKPTPPPPPVVEITKEPVEEIEEFPELPPIDDPVVEYEIPEPLEEPLPPLPPPLPIVEDDNIEEILPMSEQMPLFGGCEDKACSDEKLIKYLSRNIRYPNQARDNNIAGRVYARFVVEKDGNISNIEIIRGIGAGCDQEVLRVTEKMNQLTEGWTPGKQRGRTVRVLYTLPVTFKLH